MAASTGPITMPTAERAGSTGEESPLAASTVITVSEAAHEQTDHDPGRAAAVTAEAAAAAVVA